MPAERIVRRERRKRLSQPASYSAGCFDSRRRVNFELLFLKRRDGMKHKGRFLVRLLVFAAGVLSVALLIFSTGVVAAKRADHLGKQVWVFEWRNPLRQSPQIDFQPDSPLLI